MAINKYRFDTETFEVDDDYNPSADDIALLYSTSRRRVLGVSRASSPDPYTNDQSLIDWHRIAYAPTPIPPATPRPKSSATIHTITAANAAATVGSASWWTTTVSAGDIVYFSETVTVASGIDANPSTTPADPVFVIGSKALQTHLVSSSTVAFQAKAANMVFLDMVMEITSTSANPNGGALRIHNDGTYVDGCTFVGGPGSIVAGIRGNNTSSYSGLYVKNSRFIDCGIIGLRVDYNTSGGPYTAEDVWVYQCEFKNCGTGAIRLLVETSGDEGSRVNDVYVINNRIDGTSLAIRWDNAHSNEDAGSGSQDGVPRNSRCWIEGNVGYSCPGIIIVGAAGSDWNTNVVRRNRLNGGDTATGGVNLFWSHYVEIVDNEFSDHAISSGIDGNGILIDHDNQYIRIFGNRCHNNAGLEGVANSGCGLMILDSSDIDARWNSLCGNKNGVYTSGEDVGQRINIQYNDIADNSTDLYVHSATDDGALTFLNNRYKEKTLPISTINNPLAFAKSDL